MSNGAPRAERLHIGIFGMRNAGKSSLVNALAGQSASIVSGVAGTTTDPVYKAMEVPGIGPCVFIDTAGFDDDGALGRLRIGQAEKILEKTDIAILLLTDKQCAAPEFAWLKKIRDAGIPLLPVLNKTDLLDEAHLNERIAECAALLGEAPIPVSAEKRLGLEKLLEELRRRLPAEQGVRTITGSLCQAGDAVLLLMPQDRQAPRGRLILPQAQVIRELLDKGCVPVCCTPQSMPQALAGLSAPPRLIITDSQVFPFAWQHKPQQSALTSFSMLFAAYKGDIHAFLKGAEALDRLDGKSRVLIAEACAHAPLDEDIGRVKIPRALRKKYGEGLSVTVAGGADFPEDLSSYDLVIHCGGCMFNRSHMLSRIRRAQEAGVPISNYGIVLAKLAGILNRLACPE